MGNFKYPNIYRIENSICYIDCFNIRGDLAGTITIDSEDIDKVNIYQWHIEKSHSNIKYAQAILPNKKTLRMHKLLLPNSIQVDHINNNGLDNRKCNLRSCNNAENNRNKNFQRNPVSGYTGIRYNPKANSYYVRIMVNKKEISLGHYKDLDDAISARKAGEEKYFGEFKYLNDAEIC